MSVVISQVDKSFREVHALKQVDFRVNDGELFGLIGPDGAGKSTLFRIIVSLLVPDSGTCRVNGLDVVTRYREVRNVIGYMPGRFSLYMDLSVEENLQFYATVFGASVRANYDLIREVYRHIEPFRKRLAGRLSGGMKQKLALSCALIHKPELLILDEPTTGVDAVSRKEFWDMLKNIRNQGITVIVSTPYMDEALKCDVVALIQKGKILSLSEPREISSFFKSPLYSLRSKQSNYILLNEIRKKQWCKSAWLFGHEIHVSIKETYNTEELENEFRNVQELANFRRIKAGIEDTFIDLMERK